MTFPAITCLDGTWRLLPIDAFRQGFYPLDDDTWLTQELPAHWQQHPLLERYAGKMVYRKRFTLQEPRTGTRRVNQEPGNEADSGSRFSVDPSGVSPLGGSRFWLRLNGTFYW